MMYDLGHFGWDGCTIPTDLSGVCEQLPSWRNLKVLRPPQFAEGTLWYFALTYIKDVSGNIFLPCYDKGELANSGGGYAKIFRGRRAIYLPIGDSHGSNLRFAKSTLFEEICIKDVRLNISAKEDAAPEPIRSKTYEEEINAILYEAFLHAIFQKMLDSKGYGTAVPKLYEVVAQTQVHKDIPLHPTHFRHIWIVMEYMDGYTLEKYLQKRMTTLSRRANTEILLDILLQLSFFLMLLQTHTRFNHRDMKLNNLYVRYHAPDTGWSRTIHLPSGYEYACKNDVVLIDFGFACVSCGPNNERRRPAETLVGAGSYFGPQDDCLKYGRDLAHFLYSLHCHFPLQDYVTDDFYDFLRTALQTEHNGVAVNVLNGFNVDGTPRAHGPPECNDGIYVFLRQGGVDVLGCKPDTFLSRLDLWRSSHLRRSSSRMSGSISSGLNTPTNVKE